MELDQIVRIVAFMAVVCGLFVQTPMPEEFVLKQEPIAEQGMRVRVHLLVRRADGKVIADTQKRGLPYTFVVGDELVDPALSSGVVGMRAGEEREIVEPGRRVLIRLVSLQQL